MLNFKKKEESVSGRFCRKIRKKENTQTSSLDEPSHQVDGHKNEAPRGSGAMRHD